LGDGTGGDQAREENFRISLGLEKKDVNGKKEINISDEKKTMPLQNVHQP